MTQEHLNVNKMSISLEGGLAEYVESASTAMFGRANRSAFIANAVIEKRQRDESAFYLADLLCLNPAFKMVLGETYQVSKDGIIQRVDREHLKIAESQAPYETSPEE